MRVFCFCLGFALAFPAFPQIKPLYKEQYRPRFHFSPATNWCNDPNGLVCYNRTYHLFYQHNPFGNGWGHMTWAHSISKDLVHWKHLPIAIAEENGIMIFSGSCVADKNNTSGLGKKGRPPMIAVYTGHIENKNQSQHIAYSTDNGINWTKYEKNPVLDLSKKDFRDPKVFWYEPKKYWVMSVMFPVEHVVQFYSSKNLKEWNHLSGFGPAGDTSGVWECPDLTQVPVEGQPGKKKWLLQMSMNAAMQYFVGEFNGIVFTNENPADKIFRPDYGPDFYAAIAYNQLPSLQLPVSIGWLNNWNYAGDIPTTPWKGAMSLPRNLSVKKVNNEWVLLQNPLPALKTLRTKAIVLKKETISKTKLLDIKSQQFEMELILEPSSGSACGLRIARSANGFFEIGYDASRQLLYIDRSKCGLHTFNTSFEKLSRFETPLVLNNHLLQLHIFFDHSIVEVFANNGEAVLTAQIFPGENDNGMELFSSNGKSTLIRAALWTINSIW